MGLKVDFRKLFNFFSREVDNLIIIDLSSQLRLFDFSLKNEIKVNALDTIELTQGKREEIIVNSIQSFLSKYNILHKDAILIPSLNYVYAKRIQLPSVPAAELTEAAKWKIKDDLPFDLSKAVFDYQIIKKSVAPDGSKIVDVLCIAAEEAEVRKQVLLLKQAGLNCVGVSLLVFGYAKFVDRYLGEEKDKYLGILHLSERNSYITIAHENTIVFFRRLPLAIDKLEEALKTELVTEKGKIQLTSEEIKDVLFNYGIPSDESVAYKEKITASRILGMLRPTLEMLAQEIKRSFGYYQSQYQGGSIDKILISGEALKIPNFDKFLNKELGLDVSKFHFPEKLKFPSTVNVLDLEQSCANIGLALAYPEVINILPIEFRTEKIEAFQKVSLRWVGFVAFLLLVVSYILARAGVGAYQRRLDNANFQLNVLSEIKQVKTKVDALNSFSREVKGSQFHVAHMLEIISVISDRDLFLTNLLISTESKSGTASGFVKIKNNNPETIVRKFVTDLDNSEHFEGTSISKLTNTVIQGTNAVMFELVFKLQ